MHSDEQRSRAPQFADAVQRAEFFQTLQPGEPWHTRLVPSVVNKVNITARSRKLFPPAQSGTLRHNGSKREKADD
jgi:hypothetical protein